MFWWTVVITLLLGVATFSWIFSIYVFTHPEQPLSYRLLTRFERLDAIKQFTEKTMPGGRTYSAKDIYQKFYAWSDRQLEVNNRLLRRNYITNYRDEKPLYLRGRYKIVHARPLTGDDIFPHGLVARAVAVTEQNREFPNVMIEYVLPTEPGAVTASPFSAGDILEIDVGRDRHRLYSSLINVERLPEDSLLFTVVPLRYGPHQVDADQVITAVPPPLLNLNARLPITLDDPPAVPLAGPEAEVAAIPAGAP